MTWPIQPIQNSSPWTMKAGFLTLPDQTVVEDPTAPAGSVFYDRAFAKWLPVPRTSVSPDGRRYAYGEGSVYQGTGGKLHLVDVETGVDRVIYSGDFVYRVVDYAAEGIYLTAAPPEGYSRGLWLQDPAGGAARLISSAVVAPAVGGGAGWGLEFNKADPNPGPGGLEGPMNQIVRIDLSSGAATSWFYRPGTTLYFLGFDRAGNPFVSATNEQGAWEVWQVASRHTAAKAYAGTGPQVPTLLAAVDSHGVWFDSPYASGSSSVVWLYRGGSMQVAAAVNVGNLFVAGGCIP